MLIDTENKDGIDEMINQFNERIEQEANAKDVAITKGWQMEWKGIQNEVTEN